MNHQKHSQEEIIIFTRYPLPGSTKTRLIPELGPDGAAHVQRLMTEMIVRTARKTMVGRNLHLSLYFAGGSHEQMKDWLGPDLSLHEQVQQDLGQKMLQAFLDSRERGSERAVLIGSDCPAIDGRLITDALSSLRTCPLVLGPAADGGYYLIGTSANLPETVLNNLFFNIPWGTAGVYQKTVNLAEKAGIKTAILRQLHDIDNPPDLAYFPDHSDPQ